jgi:hypothetical protein
LFCFGLVDELSFIFSIQGIAAGLESMTVNKVSLDGQVNPKVSVTCWSVQQNCIFRYMCKHLWSDYIFVWNLSTVLG